jgi:hypothetical protein
VDAAEVVGARELRQVGEREEHAAGAGREEELRRAGDPAVDGLQVARREVELHVWLAIRAEHDAPLALVLDERRGRHHVVVLAHPARVLLADAGKRGREQPRRDRRVADQDALVEEVMDVERLVRPDPGVDAPVEEADDLGVRVRVEPASDRARPEQLRFRPRRGRAGGEHDERACARKRPPRRPPGARRLRTPMRAAPEEDAVDARRSRALRRGERARHLGHVHRLLRARRTAEAQLLSPMQRRILRGARATGQPSRRAPRGRAACSAVGVLRVRLDVQDALGAAK